MKNVRFPAIDARYDVTYFWLFVELFVLNWAAQPLATAFKKLIGMTVHIQ